MITNEQADRIRQGEEVTITIAEQPSVAQRIARIGCDADKVYVVVGPQGLGHEGEYYVRVFGHAKNGSGPVGLWQLLTDAEIAELGLEIYRFQPGGLIYRPRTTHKTGGGGRYQTAQAMAVAVWRHCFGGGSKYPAVVFL